MVTAHPRRRPRYGVDGFPYLAGLGTATIALGVPALAGVSTGRGLPRRVSWLALAIAVATGVPTVLGLRYVLSGKTALRDRMLAAVPWRGDDVVVDLGAGAGLLGIGAAARTTGVVHCVDLFIGKDLSGNSPRRLLANATIVGVAERIDLIREDVRRTTLADHSVDVVLSALCLHNIPTPEGRRDALTEIARILRPGGTVVISDLAHVQDEYVPGLTHLGLDVRSTTSVPRTFPPQHMLIATQVPREQPANRSGATARP